MAGRRYDVYETAERQVLLEVEEDLRTVGENYRQMIDLVRETGKTIERLTRNQSKLVNEIRRRPPDR